MSVQAETCFKVIIHYHIFYSQYKTKTGKYAVRLQTCSSLISLEVYNGDVQSPTVLP